MLTKGFDMPFLTRKSPKTAYFMMNGVSSIMTSSWRHNDIRFFGTLGENVEEVKLSKYTKFHAFIIICTIIPFPSHNSPDYRNND